MKTVINIGTERKNITGVIFDKPFREITYKDIQDAVVEKLGTMDGNRIHGWCDVTDTPKKTLTQ